MIEALILLVILVVAIGARRRLRTLSARIARLEGTVERLSAQALGPAASTQVAPAVPPLPEATAIPAPTPAEPATPEAITPAEPVPAAASVEVPPAADAPPAASPPSPASPRRSGRHLEERFGTRWVVWVGGLALALGAIFLVQYSIEQGLLGPGARIFLGALLAIVLIAAGEWTRRREVPLGMAGIRSAYIPGILTAAGTVAAFATAYSAYALYGFLDSTAAFVVLGVIALATLAAGLIHGPWLAALGLLGAYVTPALIASTVPNYWALYIYLTIVTAAAFAMANARRWIWLAIAAIALSVLWTFPGVADLGDGALAARTFNVVAGYVLVVVLIVSGLFLGPRAESDQVEGMSSGALTAYLLAAAALVLIREHDPLALFAFAVLFAATVAIAWQAVSATAAVPIAGLFLAVIMFDWSGVIGTGEFAPLEIKVDLVAAVLTGTDQIHIALAAVLSAFVAIAGFLAQGRSQRSLPPLLWATAAVVTPILVLIALYFRIAGLERSIPLAIMALVLAAASGWATETLSRRPPKPGSAASSAIFAVGSVAALALALNLVLEKGWLTAALALMVPGIAWVALRRPWGVLRWLAIAITAIVVGRVSYEPRIVPDLAGSTPIFNWLLYGYGVPAVSFWAAGYLLRRRADDTASRLADSAAILFTALLFFWQIRHLANGGDIYAVSTNLGEIALQVCVALALSLGLELVRERSHNIVHDVGAQIMALLALVGIVLGLILIENPLWNRIAVGGPFANLILLGYGLPAILTAILGLYTRATRPQWYRTIASVTAVVLALFYLTMEVRRFYHGPIFAFAPIADSEQYTLSAVWLIFGVLLLLAGIVIRSQPVRLASAAVVILTIGKVFVVDLAGLTGVFRALSFIFLGAVLVAIGWLYQRLLFPRPPRQSAAPPAPPGPASPVAPQ